MIVSRPAFILLCGGIRCLLALRCGLLLPSGSHLAVLHCLIKSPDSLPHCWHGPNPALFGPLYNKNLLIPLLLEHTS